MKKKLLFAVLLLATTAGLKAQTNIQEMYDFNRGHLTTTLEMFKGDPWGSTFFFNDIYHPFDMHTPTGYYTEIARAINLWHNTALAPVSLHVEWNGGMYANKAWLFGVEYFLHSQDFRNTFTFELMYKCFSQLTQPDIPLQFTFVWGMKDLFGVRGLTFSGFLDIWGENQTWLMVDLPSEETQLVVLSEPQLWYCIGQHFGCPNLNIGGEVELAYNFAGGWKEFALVAPGTLANQNKGFTVAPCLGVKWVF